MTIKNNPPPPELASIGCCHLNKKKLDCYLAQTHSFHLFQVSKLFSFTWTMGALACKLLYYLQVGEKERNAHSEFPNPVLCRFFYICIDRPCPECAPSSTSQRSASKGKTEENKTKNDAVFSPFLPSYTREFTLAAKSFTFATLLFPLFSARGKILQRRRMDEGRTRVAFPFMFF